ncbi:MAG TPA: HDOD domain-containing protein [Steroidobacteraceae bacterium]|nr:HDOD domain-containing protein [Steroidobacteraceae bacterium]
MNKASAQPDGAPGDPRAFAFVQQLASELSKGKVDLPSFPDVALRVRKVLSDENVSQDKVVRVVGSEPALAARLMQIANSAALNFSGKPITELRTAIARMGFNMVRSAAIAFAMSQLKKVDSLKGLEAPLEDLWKRSATVAAMSHAVARRFSRVNPDTALLAGLLHGIGQLYILTRSSQHPGLFENQVAYAGIVRDWHSAIAKALLENWDMTEEIVEAVSNYEDLERVHSGPVDLTDVLTVGNLLAAFKSHPENIELNMHDVAACKRMQADRAAYEELIKESEHEIDNLLQALGT